MKKKSNIGAGKTWKISGGLRYAAAALMISVLLAGCQNPDTTKNAGAETSAESGSGSAAETGAESGSESAAETSDGTAADTLFGSFQTVTLDGEEVSEEIFGQSALTMINIWATYCGPCIQEMPDLAELSQEYGGEDFQILGIVTDAMKVGDKNAAEIIEQTGADYTHLLISQDMVNGYLATVQAVPTTVFVDQEGHQVGQVYMGAREKDDWEAIIKELMEAAAE